MSQTLHMTPTNQITNPDTNARKKEMSGEPTKKTWVDLCRGWQKGIMFIQNLAVTVFGLETSKICFTKHKHKRFTAE